VTDESKEPRESLVSADWAAVPNIQRFAHQAMATTFEIVVQHEDVPYARGAANAAFAELDRIEGMLSRYIENSDIARINALPAAKALPLSLDTFECLKISAQMHAETKGAFDVTVGLLVDCWRDKDKKPRTPSAQELQFAREHTGAGLILLDEATHAMALTRSPVRVDLGGVGKGYGVDRMAEALREWSIDRALIHGGFSSVLALDAPEGAAGWPVTLSHPADRTCTLARVELERIAVGGSGLERGPHIIDPRMGKPVQGMLAAWSMAPDAARADALSTAFMIMTPEEIGAYCAAHSAVRGLVIVPADRATGAPERIRLLGHWRDGEIIA
jgi:thiamine biosynthesis lipoprotein